MKTRSLIIAGLLLGVIVLAGPQMAVAANNYTPACTQISNIATISYQVGGVQQANIQSNGGTPTTFYVGVKVDVLVTRTDLAAVTVYPGSLATALTFSITNNGNATQKYALTAIPEANGTANPFLGILTDTFNGTNPVTNGTAGLTSSIATLAPDASQAVTIVVDTPLGQANNDLAVYGLMAQSQWIGTSTDINSKNGTAAGTLVGGALCNALGATTVDVVAADGAGADDSGANDGAHSARDAYLVSAANLTIAKSQAVYWDPVNLLVSPKAIPGAVITYTVTITNAASVAQATNVNLVDDLNNEIAVTNHLAFGNGMTGAPNTSFNDSPGGGTTNCTGSGAGYGIVVDGVCKSNVFAGNDGASWSDAGDANGGTNKVSVTGLTVNASSSVVIKYQATIQ
jgi:hypothetical protein